jgi:hypothetical protein
VSYWRGVRLQPDVIVANCKQQRVDTNELFVAVFRTAVDIVLIQGIVMDTLVDVEVHAVADPVVPATPDSSATTIVRTHLPLLKIENLLHCGHAIDRVRASGGGGGLLNWNNVLRRCHHSLRA